MATTGTTLVGCGAGFSGDRLDAAAPVVRTLIASGLPSAIMFETLAERTLALAQLAKLKNPDHGYEPLLERLLSPILDACVRHGVRIVGNFGAANPQGAARAIRALARRLGIPGIRVGIVTGDDLLARGLVVALRDEQGRPVSTEGLLSANAYLGAEPILEALETDADVVVTGRVADPSLAVAAFAYQQRWSMTDVRRIACATAAGHLLECGAQVTGGYYADPGVKDVPEPDRIGFPIVAMDPDGQFTVTKADDSGGLVDRHTVTEQLLYEIHDPAQYLTPDVVLDVTGLELTEIDRDRVRVTGVAGHPRPDRLKVTTGYDGGWLGEGEISYSGPNAVARARLALDIVRRRVGPGVRMRGDIVGVASVLNDDRGEWLARADLPGSDDVRLRVAIASADPQVAARAQEEVLALYTCGPAGGGGVRGSLRRRVTTGSAYVARDLVRATVEVVE